MVSLEMILENLLANIKELEILPFDPFQMVDKEGVSELMKIAIRKARQVKPNIPIEFVVSWWRSSFYFLLPEDSSYLCFLLSLSHSCS